MDDAGSRPDDTAPDVDESGIGQYLPARIGTTGELSILLAGLDPETRLRLPGAIRIDPQAIENGFGVAVPIASIEQPVPGAAAPARALRLGLLVLADPDQPVTPEACRPINPLDRLREATARDGDSAIAAIAAAEGLDQIADDLDVAGFPERVTRLVATLRQLAAELADESALIEIERALADRLSSPPS